MKHPYLLALAAAAVLAAAPLPLRAQPRKPAPAAKAQTPAPPSAPLAALFEAYSEEVARLFPLGATAQGDHRYNDQLPNDQTRARRETVRAFYHRSLAQLRRLERARLNAADQTSYDILAYSLNQRLAGSVFNDWMMPFDQSGGLPTALAQLGAGTGAQPFKTVPDYDHWLSRVRGFPAWTDSAIANFRQGIRAGVVLPKALVPKMVSQLRTLAKAGADPATSLFYGPVKTFPASFTAADKAR
ncbi:DUF885 family protein, partial [Hymenobacter sp. B1770]|uniref:DUF885 family protein n=1 Tax=Hymenobacter sp. B1770 TaxID=1718788 RepID=UPI003CFB2B95